MTMLMTKLNKRMEIREATQTPNDKGGMDQLYDIKTTVWGGIKPISFRTGRASYVREQQIGGTPTHTITMRKNPSLGVTFLEDTPYLRSDYYIFMSTGAERGRLFRIDNVTDKDEKGEYVVIEVIEIESQTGMENIQ